jgi:hypothetical protein
MKVCHFRPAIRLLLIGSHVLLLAAVDGNAGGPLATVSNRAVVFRSTAFPLTWRLDPGSLGFYTNGDAANIATASFVAWDTIATASLSFNRGANLPVDVTISNYTTYWGKYDDGINPVILDSDGEITDAIRGKGAKNQVVGLAVSAYFTSGPNAGFYAEGEVLINGFLSDKTSPSQYLGVVKHEIGHLLGLDHAQIGKHEGLDGDDNNDAAVPLMFPISTANSVFTADDILAASLLYPPSGFLNNRGTLRGTIKRRDGSSVRGANVVAISADNPDERYSTVTDYLGNTSGVYEFKALPPGNYFIFADAVVPIFNGGSSVGPYAKDGNALSFVRPIDAEYYNGALESHDHLADRPDHRMSVTVAAGQTTDNINFLINDPPNQILDRYYADSAAIALPLPLPGQSTSLVAAATRFSPGISGTLLWIRVFFNGGTNGVQGSGALRFSVWRPSTVNPTFPGTVVDQFDVPLNELTKGLVLPYEIGVGDRNIAVSAGEDFFVSVEVVGNGSVQLLMDDGVTRPSSRTTVQTRAGTWLSTAQAFEKSYNAMLAVAIGGQPQEEIPLEYVLDQNYPNPLNLSNAAVDFTTTIRFVLPQASKGELKIFDLLGRPVWTSNETDFQQGFNFIFWDGRDDNGRRLPAGIYFYRLRAENFEAVKKLTLVR